MRFAVAVAACAAAGSADTWYATAFNAFKATAHDSKQLAAELKQWQRHESDPSVFSKISAELGELTHEKSQGESIEDQALQEALGEAEPAQVAPPAAAAAPVPALSAVSTAASVHHVDMSYHFDTSDATMPEAIQAPAVQRHAVKDMWNWKPVSVAADDAAAKSAMSGMAALMGGGGAPVSASSSEPAVDALDSTLAHDGKDLDFDADDKPAPPARAPALRPRPKRAPRAARPAPVAPVAPAAWSAPAAPAAPAAPFVPKVESMGAYADFFKSDPSDVQVKPSHKALFSNKAMEQAQAPVFRGWKTVPAAEPAPVAEEAPAPVRRSYAPPAPPAETAYKLNPAPKDEDVVEAEQAKVRADIARDQQAVDAPVAVSATPAVIEGKADSDPELRDVQAENPMAYAMVKALLLKKSMGLIKERNPADSEEGGESFDAPPAHKTIDMFSWHPHDSAVDLGAEAAASPASAEAPASAPTAKLGAGGLASYLGVHKTAVRDWTVPELTSPEPPAVSMEPIEEAPAPVYEAPAPAPIALVAPAPVERSPPSDMFSWHPSDSAADLISVDPDNKDRKDYKAAKAAPVEQVADKMTSSVLDQFMADIN